ncbi:MAG: TIR domain-containing protein [Paracoccaceae bacterium]
MSRIFLSYAREDAVAALEVFSWLEGNGWKDDVFRDDHPQHGITGGKAWRDALRNAAGRCEAVVILISRSWLDSPMCWSEFEMAERYHKAILPVVLDGELEYSEIPVRITNSYQLIDRAKSPDEEFHQRLRNALSQSGTGPESFALPVDAHPYPGLGALTANDAALFFGRDVEVMQSTEMIRDIRATGQQKMLMILGSSGSGKSSLLRAGIWPRLNRDDRNFLALPVIRPVNAVLTGEAGLWRSLAQILTDKRWAPHLAPRTPRTRAALARAIEGSNPEGLLSVLDALRTAAAKAQLNAGEALPEVVIPIDQAEELFSSEGREQADRFLDLLRPLLADESGVAVVLTMRSDLVPRLQTDPRFVQEALRLFNLPPMPATSLPQVIEGPAERMGLFVDPLLTSALLTDSRGADALPLLAFTLRELFDGRHDLDRMTLADYESIGGVRMAIQSTAQRARAETLASGVPAADYNGLLQRSFIPHLVRINESGQPARRVVRLTEFDADCLPVIHNLVAQRLLVSGTDGTFSTVEIAHEAVLREWPEVEALVAQHRDYLAWREQVSRQQAEHQAGRGDLLTGRALAIALDFVEEFGHTTAVDVQAFVSASQEAFEADRIAREAERERVRQAEVEAAQTRAREARRNSWRIGIFASVVSILAIGLGVVMWQANIANEAAEREALVTESLRLAAQAQELAGQSSWPAGRAIAWLALPHDAELSERPITDEAATAIYRNGAEVILDDTTVYEAIYAPTGPFLLLMSEKSGRVRVLNTVTQQVLIDQTLRGWTSWVGQAPNVEEPYEKPSTGKLRHPVFSSDGQFLSVLHGDGAVEVWQISDGSIVGSALYDPTDIAVILSQDGSLLLRISTESRLTLVDLRAGDELLDLGHYEPSSENFGPSSIDNLFVDPSQRILWVSERDSKGYPTLIAFDRATASELGRISIGNDSQFAVDPDAGALILNCGLNNPTTITDVKEALAVTGPIDPEAQQLGLKFIYPAASGFVLTPVSGGYSYGEDPEYESECATSGDSRLAILNYGDRLVLFDMVTSQIEEVTGRIPQFLTSNFVDHYSGVLETNFRFPFGLSHDGSVVYGIVGSSGSTGSRALVFHYVGSGELIARIEPSPRIRDFLVDNAARTAVVETIDGAVSVWDVATGVKLSDVRGPNLEGEEPDYSSYENIQIEPSGNSLNIIYGEQGDYGWVTNTGTILYRIRPDATQLVMSEASYRAGHILGGGSGAILGTTSGLIEHRGLDGKLLAQVEVHTGAVVSLVPAGGEILTAGWDGVVAALNRSNLTVQSLVHAHDTAVSALIATPDGELIATGARDGALAIWSGGLTASPLLLSGHDASISQLLFTVADDGLISASHDGRILLHDIATGETRTEIVATGPPVWDMVAVPGSDLIVASRGSGEVIAWDQPGTTFPRWKLNLSSRVRTLAVDLAGRHLALGLEDGRVLVKNDPAAGSSPFSNELRSFDGHRSAIVGLAFINKGALLAGISRDRTLRLWDVETGRQVAVWESSGNIPLALLAEAEGRNAITLFDDNLIEFWRLPGATLREVIADVGQTLALFPPIPFALCDQLRVTGIPGAARVCAPPE